MRSLVAIVAAAISMAIGSMMGIDDDDGYTLRVARRVARRTGKPISGDVPGDPLPRDRRARPAGPPARHPRRHDAEHGALAGRRHATACVEWETDLSSQTGASQAGILLGDNDDIPAFRWVDKATGTMMTCSNPDDCATIERDRSGSPGLLADGGTSRGNLLSGGADAAILTVSRLSAEKSANPGYRAFLANGQNVTRTLVLFLWELYLELVAASQQRRRDVHPRGHRGGSYPLIRAGMCVFVRDLIVYSVLQDMFRGVPAVYATFSSYDEVAHHSGLERPDTIEALRKLDQRFGLIERARRYAPRPYEIVVLSDHGQTQGATFRQRNGYGLDDLVQRSLSQGRVQAVDAGDENAGGVGRALDEATGRAGTEDGEEKAEREVIVLGSGNLGLVYLMESPHRLTLEEIRERHPDLIPAICEHPHVGFALVRSAEDGAVVLGAGGSRRLADGKVEGEDPLAGFPPNAARHLRRTDGFPHVPDIVVNSFFDPVTEEGCAFEELISFHGGMGGPQTRAVHPVPRPPGAAPGAARRSRVGAPAAARLEGRARGRSRPDRRCSPMTAGPACSPLPSGSRRTPWSCSTTAASSSTSTAACSR